MMHQRMDLSKGFQIEQPHVFVPWDTPESQFQGGFEGLHLRHVTHGYFTTHCTSLQGLSHELGFHFYPRNNGRLVEFEFFRNSYSDLAASYQEFQRHLEATFGQPASTRLRRLSFAYLAVSGGRDRSPYSRALRTSGVRQNQENWGTQRVAVVTSPLH